MIDSVNDWDSVAGSEPRQVLPLEYEPPEVDQLQARRLLQTGALLVASALFLEFIQLLFLLFVVYRLRQQWKSSAEIMRWVGQAAAVLMMVGGWLVLGLDIKGHRRTSVVGVIVKVALAVPFIFFLTIALSTAMGFSPLRYIVVSVTMGNWMGSFDMMHAIWLAATLWIIIHICLLLNRTESRVWRGALRWTTGVAALTRLGLWSGFFLSFVQIISPWWGPGSAALNRLGWVVYPASAIAGVLLAYVMALAARHLHQECREISR